jgi:hypothetical protein
MASLTQRKEIHIFFTALRPILKSTEPLFLPVPEAFYAVTSILNFSIRIGGSEWPFPCHRGRDLISVRT